MNPDTARSRRVRSHLTACHGACTDKQPVRRHPWRKSHGLQTGQAPRQARTANPWPTSFKCSGFVRDARRPWLAVVSFSYRSSWEWFYASQQKGKKPPYCCLSDHPPSPSRGQWRPSNITRDYAQYRSCTLLRASVGATSLLSAAPHNQRYV
jgi:hypothetical protein